MPVFLLGLAFFFLLWAAGLVFGVQDWSWWLWWLLLLVPPLVAISLVCIGVSVWTWFATIVDLINGSVEIQGPVSRWMTEVQLDEGGTSYHYEIQVQGREFEVERSIYYWVSEGEKVVVRFWPRTKTVIEVRKLKEDTAHQLTRTEREKATATQGATPEQFADRFD